MRGLTLPTRRDPRNAKEVGLNSPGLLLHVRPGGRQKYGAATAGGPPLRAGRLLTFFVRPSAAPRTQKKETPQETVAHALTAPHPVQPYCDTVARSRSRTWRFTRHTQHAQNVHAQCDTNLHTHGYAAVSFPASTTSPTDLPGAQLREVVRKAFDLLCETLPQRPRTQKKETPQETVAHALTAPHPVQPYCDTVARSRSRTWRFIHSLIHSFVCHTRARAV